MTTARPFGPGLCLILIALAMTTACAARSAVVSTANDQARAEELIREGCYDCLLEAHGIYERIAVTARRAVLIRMFEVDLLLALREKELAIDPAATIARATALGSELGPAVDAARYLAIVEAIPPDTVGTPRAGRRPPLIVAGPGARDKYVAETFATIRASAFTPAAREYLEFSVQCNIAPDTVDLTRPATVDVPLLRYRRATCMNPLDVAALEQVRSAVPRFVEVTLFLGRAAMASFARSDGARVREFFEEAYARFPNSPAVTFHLATVAQATGDCRRGEGFFTETLALREQHEDARLGRVICRTYLSNAESAIADATTLIQAATYNRAEAYYWRAWNRRSQKRLDMARADIDASRALLYNARVLTLAGMIEHDQADFDKARDDLTRAREMDSRECQARWYLGLVGYGTEKWPESAAGFADSADCYARLIADTEKQREAMAQRDDVSEEFRARQLAGFNAAIAEDSTQKSAADLNAAINYARAGDVANATVYMKRAAVDPERRVAVEDLRQVLGVPRW